MGKNENQMAKQACENAVDSKHYSTLGLWVPGAGNRVRIKNFAGSSNSRSSSSKIRVIITAKIHEHLLCTGALYILSFHPSEHSTLFCGRQGNRSSERLRHLPEVRYEGLRPKPA